MGHHAIVAVCAALVLLFSITAAAAHFGFISFGGACSLWFDRLGPFDWHQCCVQHDTDYVNQIGKTLADAHLGSCVEAIWAPMGELMCAAVTVCGGAWYAAAARKPRTVS